MLTLAGDRYRAGLRLTFPRHRGTVECSQFSQLPNWTAAWVSGSCKDTTSSRDRYDALEAHREMPGPRLSSPFPNLQDKTSMRVPKSQETATLQNVPAPSRQKCGKSFGRNHLWLPTDPPRPGPKAPPSPGPHAPV